MDITNTAKELKLCAVGVAKAEDLDAEYKRLLDWIMKGYHGKMEWLAKSAKRRSSPSQLMPAPKSVIVCALRYADMPLIGPMNRAATVAAPFMGPKYLQHEDYHIVMMEKLEALVAEIKKEHPNAHFKCYVDTGPVLEKAWAARAGLGFIGKNTLLIVPEFGSQVALGVVVTDVELKQEAGSKKLDFPASSLQPPASECSSCELCIQACPHQALVAPYVLDAKKCISYNYLIEKREGGCDICQDVCPFNRRPI